MPWKSTCTPTPTTPFSINSEACERTKFSRRVWQGCILLLLSLMLLQGIPVTSHCLHMSPVTFPVLSRGLSWQLWRTEIYKEKTLSGPAPHCCPRASFTAHLLSQMWQPSSLLCLPPPGFLPGWGMGEVLLPKKSGETALLVGLQASLESQVAVLSSQSEC